MAVTMGDKIADPAGARYTVAAVSGGKLLIEDSDGGRWVIARRRLAENWRIVRESKRGER